MRSLYEIKKANAEREAREEAGDFAVEPGSDVEEDIFRSGGYDPCEGACGETRVECKCVATIDTDEFNVDQASGYMAGLDRAIDLLEAGNPYGRDALLILKKERDAYGS